MLDFSTILNYIMKRVLISINLTTVKFLHICFDTVKVKMVEDAGR